MQMYLTTIRLWRINLTRDYESFGKIVEIISKIPKLATFNVDNNDLQGLPVGKVGASSCYKDMYKPSRQLMNYSC